MARAYREAKITAIDLTPPDIPNALPNLEILKHDAELDWPFEEGKFDFIHGRMLMAGIHDWRGLLSKIWQHLAPGGSIELLNLKHPYRAVNEQADCPEASPLIRFSALMKESWIRSGLDWDAIEKVTTILPELGFENVEECPFIWPLGEWADTDRERQMGLWTMENFSTFIQNVGVPVLTKNEFMSKGDAEDAVTSAIRDLKTSHLANRYYIQL